MRLLFNSLRESRRKKEFPPIATVKISLRRKCLFGIFTCSHITFAIGGNSFFLFVGSAPEGMDAIVFGEGDGEEDRKVPACSEDFFHGSRLLKFRKQVIFGYRSLKVPSGFLNRLYVSIIMFTNHEIFFQLLNYTNPKVFTHLNKTHPTHTSSPA